jgi:hypothetical protein
MRRSRTKAVSVPYADASTGQKARKEITRTLRRLGCEQIGFMDNFDDSEVLLAFVHRGRQVQLRASAKGWAAMYLRCNPWHGNRRTPRHDYELKALAQGYIAVNSVLRDWVKGSVTAIESGILSVEAVFMPFMLTADGRPLLERAVELLPKPEDKVVMLGR